MFHFSKCGSNVCTDSKLIQIAVTYSLLVNNLNYNSEFLLSQNNSSNLDQSPGGGLNVSFSSHFDYCVNGLLIIDSPAKVRSLEANKVFSLVLV